MRWSGEAWQPVNYGLPWSEPVNGGQVKPSDGPADLRSAPRHVGHGSASSDFFPEMAGSSLPISVKKGKYQVAGARSEIHRWQ
jgi:hypothetical protein